MMTMNGNDYESNNGEGEKVQNDFHNVFSKEINEEVDRANK